MFFIVVTAVNKDKANNGQRYKWVLNFHGVCGRVERKLEWRSWVQGFESDTPGIALTSGAKFVAHDSRPTTLWCVPGRVKKGFLHGTSWQVTRMTCMLHSFTLYKVVYAYISL